MNTTRLIAPLSIALLIAASSCGNKKSEAAVEREKWLLSLNDSISLYQTQIDSVTRALSEMQGNVGSIIGDFDYVNNPVKWRVTIYSKVGKGDILSHPQDL